MNNNPNFPDISEEHLKLVAQAYAMRQRYWPAFTWLIQTELLKDFDPNNTYYKEYNIDIKYVKTKLSDLFNKINASFYHLQKIKENENQIIEIGKQIANSGKKDLKSGVLGIAGMPFEPINYEYEAMLVTLKSAIDILITIQAPICGLPPNVDNLYRFVDQSKKLTNKNAFFTKVQEVFNNIKFKVILDEFLGTDTSKSKRNFAVHRGSLSTGTINIQFASTTKEIGVLKSKMVEVDNNPQDIRKTPDLDTYTEIIFYTTCDFLMELLELVTNRELPRGKKMSVYESRTTSTS